MDFELTDDQVSLQEAIRAFCDGRFPPDVVRNIEHAGARLDRELWHELGDTGVFSLRVPEDDGGLGLGVSEAVLVFEELGRALGARARSWPRSWRRAISTRGRRRRTSSSGWWSATTPASIVLEHPTDLDALAGARRRRRPPRRPRRRSRASTPSDRSTRSRRSGMVSGALPDGELVGGPEAAAQLRREGLVLTSGPATRHRRAHRRARRPSTPRSASSSAGRSVRSRR